MEYCNGLENYYVIQGNKKLRLGYTTGSCAAAACKGAVRMLLSGEEIREVDLETPGEIRLHLQIKDILRTKTSVSCAVQKDGGDDPDTTDGLLIYAKAELCEGKGIFLDGGRGVGRVTKPGLACKVGEAAINPVPRKMILTEAEEAVLSYGYTGGLCITISVPKGEETAKKTFNPRLGIEGGISILGTTGIVRPMSEKALVDTIKVEIRQHRALGEEYLLVTPGNYGEKYLRDELKLPWAKNIKCSNYVGETIDLAMEAGARGVLFVAHIGKFVKLAAGIMNTHSHWADGRMEILAANAIRAGAGLECVKEILACSTTDEALEVLQKAGLLKETMKEVLERIQFYLNHRSYEHIKLGAVIFSNVYGYLGHTEDAGELMELIQKQDSAQFGSIHINTEN